MKQYIDVIKVVSFVLLMSFVDSIQASAVYSGTQLVNIEISPQYNDKTTGHNLYGEIEVTSDNMTVLNKALVNAVVLNIDLQNNGMYILEATDSSGIIFVQTGVMSAVTDRTTTGAVEMSSDFSYTGLMMGFALGGTYNAPANVQVLGLNKGANQLVLQSSDNKIHVSSLINNQGIALLQKSLAVNEKLSNVSLALDFNDGSSAMVPLTSAQLSAIQGALANNPVVVGFSLNATGGNYSLSITAQSGTTSISPFPVAQQLTDAKTKNAISSSANLSSSYIWYQTSNMNKPLGMPTETITFSQSTDVLASAPGNQPSASPSSSPTPSPSTPSPAPAPSRQAAPSGGGMAGRF